MTNNDKMGKVGYDVSMPQVKLSSKYRYFGQISNYFNIDFMYWKYRYMNTLAI